MSLIPSQEKLQALFAILRDIHVIREPDALWRYVLERSCVSLQAEGGSFFLVKDDGRMVVAAAVGVDEEALSRVPMRVGVGIGGWAAEQRKPALVPDTQSDSRFNPLADQVTGAQTRSILAVPIFSEGRTHGVLELINCQVGFAPEDLDLMSALGQQTAIAYQNLLLARETFETKVLLESLLVNMSGGLIALEMQGNIRLCNPAAVQLLGLTEDAIGKPAAAVLMDNPIVFNLLRKTLTTGQSVSRQEITMPVRGNDVRFGYTTILITDAEKAVLGSAILFQRLS